MGLKQRVLFESQQPVVGFSYNKELVQGTFIHTLYQGLNEKNSHVRRDLKPFLWQAGRTSRHWLSPTKVVGKREEVAGEGQPAILSSDEPREKVKTPKRSQSNSRYQSDPKKRVAQLIGKRCMVSCSINGVPLQMLLDSGAQVTMVSKSWIEQALP